MADRRLRRTFSEAFKAEAVRLVGPRSAGHRAQHSSWRRRPPTYFATVEGWLYLAVV